MKNQMEKNMEIVWKPGLHRPLLLACLRLHAPSSYARLVVSFWRAPRAQEKSTAAAMQPGFANGELEGSGNL